MGKPPPTTAAAAGAEREHLSNDAVALARHTDESSVCERGRAVSRLIDMKGYGTDSMKEIDVIRRKD